MSTTTPISGSSSSNSATYSGGSNSSGGLSQADFLKIMVAQFTNQAPLSDSDGSGSSGTSDYVQELMSMTNIETLQTMSSQQNIVLAGSLPGSTVELNNNGALVTGKVTSAQIENAALYVTINGQQFPASDITAITQTQSQSTAASSSTSSTSSTTPATSS